MMKWIDEIITKHGARTLVLAGFDLNDGLGIVRDRQGRQKREEDKYIGNFAWQEEHEAGKELRQLLRLHHLCCATT
eukprot:7680431-Lingulodinium_polyedra.AAC.1